MKARYYLRGIGIGIILATVILSFTKPKTSDKEIIKQAEKLGMVFKNENDISSLINGDSKGEVNSNKNDVVNDEDSDKINLENNNEINSNEEKLNTNEKNIDVADDKKLDNLNINDDQNPDSTESEQDESNDVPVDNDANNKEEDSTARIYISHGMSASKVATLLFKKGLIDDKKEFNSYIVDKKKAESINVGEYEIPFGISYKEIAKIITER